MNACNFFDSSINLRGMACFTWRPESISFAAKSKWIAQITAVAWVLSYVAGVLSFEVLHTTLSDKHQFSFHDNEAFSSSSE